MILYYINGVDRSGDVTANTLRITNQIQQRTNNCAFDVFQGSKPTENQDLKIYAAGEVVSVNGQVITLTNYQREVGRFYVGQQIHLRIGETDDTLAIVTAYNDETGEVTVDVTLAEGNDILQEDGFGILTEDSDDLVQEDGAGSGLAIAAGDLVGVLIFGGVIAGVEDFNVDNINILEWHVTGLDYTKIFDKKLISDTWEDVDSRYIINDFVNSTVNYNQTIDTMDYDDNTAIQAEWIESGDGTNPTIDSADFMEGDASALLAWTFSGGTALFSATPTGADASEFTGVSSGTPTEGELMAWVKASLVSAITSLKVRIGSDSSNYARLTLELADTTDWQYVKVDLDTAEIVGTPDWTARDYAAIEITETASANIRINGLRINQSNSFSLYNVQSTPNFDDLRSPQLKPTALINLLSKTWEYVWFIDYEKDIHFKTQETENAPYGLSDTSDNFTGLEIEVDASNLGNRVLVRGGEKTSASRYAQVVEGDGTLREWLMKAKFNDMEVSMDDGGTTFAAEATTNTTTIKKTAHGLTTGDHIINRTRSNAVRAVTVVDANTLTVETVTGQTSGDTISTFATALTLGIEGITDEGTVAYVANSNEKSVRATASTLTLVAGTFLRFEYNERVPIQVQYVDSSSANALKALGYGDGIFDLDPITDRNISDTNTALAVAQAKVNQFANAVINGRFETDHEGLRGGQLLHVQETNRALDNYYVVQKVDMRLRGGEFKDYFEISVTFGTTLFGWIEFMQKLLSAKDGIEVNTDDIVETFVTGPEEVGCDDVSQAAAGGIKSASISEEVGCDDVNLASDFTPPWKWETSVGQPLRTRWGLFEWS